MLLPEKRCTHCGEVQVIEEFGKHPTTRDGRQSWCKACTRASAQKMRDEQPERCRAAVAAAQAANAEGVKAWRRAHYQANREELIEGERRRRAARKAAGIKRRLTPKAKSRKAEAYRKWQQAHPAAVRAYARGYYARKPGQVRGWQHNRRARIQGNGGTYTNEAWLALCTRFGNRCLACGEARPLTVDHVQPLSRGGSNVIENIQPLCKPCNSRKRARAIDYRVILVA